MSNNRNIVIIVILIITGIGFFYLNQQEKTRTSIQRSNLNAESNELKPIDSITHGHGIAVNVEDPSIIYIATHHGLLALKNEKDLYQIGTNEDDYMSFSSHPSDPNIFFSSGHPNNGGNIGFQKSEDGGITWKKVSDGINGPVDFHAMAISSANPNLLYGWYGGTVQRSNDQGKTWEIASTTSYPITNLAIDPKNENVVYSATPQGLRISNNRGTDWSTLLDGLVTTIAVDPLDAQKLLSFSQKYRFAKSNDRGKTWKSVSETFGGESPLFIAFNKQSSQIVYTMTEKNSIYKSSDGGNRWDKIR